MTDLEKFQLVNSCETENELKKAILKLADENGMIQGRKRSFSAYEMADSVQYVINDNYPANALTREFGIRQQALYIAYYRS